MQNKYLSSLVVHEAEITNSIYEELRIYYGLTETTFKVGTKHHLTEDIAWKALNYLSSYGHWQTKIKHRLWNGQSLKGLIAELN